MTRVLETDENGALTIPAEILDDARPHERYVVEREGARLSIRPDNPTRTRNDGHEERMRRWRELGDIISAAWPEGVSATDAVSEQRR